MYLPPTAKPVSSDTKSKHRILLQGAPSTGKSTSCLSFPNPLWLDFDNKLPKSAETIHAVPFWNAAFVAQELKSPNPRYGQPNRIMALKKWLETEGPKLAPEQTLVVDSWTRVQDSFDYQYGEKGAEPIIAAKTGLYDTFGFWGLKLDVSTELCVLLTALPCNYVIVICHEQKQRADDGRLIDKIEPLQQGKFCAKIGGYFTDVFRQVVVDELDAKGQPVTEKQKMPSGKEIDVRRSQYLWQTKSNGEVNLNCSFPGLPVFIPANYKSLL